MSWLAYALISAVAAALTAILAKLGVEGVPSTLATAIRTVVVTVFAWAMVFALSKQRAIGGLLRRTIVFLH
jgi:transporter family protein